MKVNILNFIEGARQARGTTVIIDVFRAFSTVCYVYGRGAIEVIAVGDLDTAYTLKQKNPAYVLMGERGGIIQPGFDLGNSPTHANAFDFTGKFVILTTSAGTKGIVNAIKGDEILTGSFVNAQAIIDYILRKPPGEVSLVCMGLNGNTNADEDSLCAQYLKKCLLGEPVDYPSIMHHLRHESKTGRFLDVTDRASAPAEDFERCLDLNRFDFVLKAQKRAEGSYLLARVT